MSVRFAAGDGAPDVVRERRIEVDLPPGLLAGPNTVQVLHDVALGIPPVPHRGFESNVPSVVLAPTIATALPRPPAALGNLVLPAAPAVVNFDLTVSPPVAREQRVELLLGENVVERQPRPAGEAPTQDVRFELDQGLSPAPASTFPADLPVQVRVDEPRPRSSTRRRPGRRSGRSSPRRCA